MSVIHADFTIERHYDCSPQQAFSGFSDPELKRQWFAVPTGWTDPIWELDFRVGGGEVSGGRSPGGTSHSSSSRYHDIVEDERIVFAYDLAARRPPDLGLADDGRVLRPRKAGTRLLFTEQGAFFDGLDDPAEREHGTGKLLDALGKRPRGGAGPMTLTLHEHPFAAYCWKPLIALYERDVPFERHFVGGEDDRAELAKLWPTASIPVLRRRGGAG